MRLAVSESEVRELALVAKLTEMLADANLDWWQMQDGWLGKNIRVRISGVRRVQEIAANGIPYAYRLFRLDARFRLPCDRWKPIARRTPSGNYTVIFTLPQIAHQLLHPYDGYLEV